MSVTGDTFHALERHLEAQDKASARESMERTCEWCGAPFTTSNDQQRYCRGPGKRCVHKASAFRKGKRLSGPEGDGSGRPASGTRQAILAAANPDRGEWREQAACRACDPPDLFYPGGDKGQWQPVIDEAKAVCEACPVRAACLAYALDAREDFGIWGGLTEVERRPLLIADDGRLGVTEDAGQLYRWQQTARVSITVCLDQL